jgi:antirestriction protein ArdC
MPWAPRSGRQTELVVNTNSITRTETDAKGEEAEREIPYMKGYTVFNAKHSVTDCYYARHGGIRSRENPGCG